MVEVASFDHSQVHFQYLTQRYTWFRVAEISFDAFCLGQFFLFIMGQLILANNCPCCMFHHSPISFGSFSLTDCYINDLRMQYIANEQLEFKTNGFTCIPQLQLILIASAFFACFHAAFNTLSTLVYSVKCYKIH